ncbi:MAG: GDP-L-fucose synthase [Chlamydiota bacterium]
MNKSIKIYVAGHKGLAGSAILRKLKKEGYANLLLRTSAELDLTNQLAVQDFFQKEKPDYVFLAAAKVGGILANSRYPASFIYNNLMIQSNVLESAYQSGVKRLLFLGSSCIYPRNCPQPIKEEYLLSSELEPTNRPYAIAKIAGVEATWSYNRQYGTRFLSIMPTNLYGPGDNYDLQNSHVLPALLRKMHEAKNTGSPVTVWGTGAAKREFLYSDDLAAAAVFLMALEENGWQKIFLDKEPLFNVGYGTDLSIKELVTTIAEAVDFKGDLLWDTSKPDGTPRKFLDCTRIFALGWRPETPLQEGLIKTYEDFCRNGFRG